MVDRLDLVVPLEADDALSRPVGSARPDIWAAAVATWTWTRRTGVFVPVGDELANLATKNVEQLGARLRP